MLKLTVKNLDKLLNKVQVVSAQIKKDTEETEYNIAKKIYAESQRLVPIDTGYLKESGKIVLKENKTFVEYQTPYAIFVHERLDLYHPNGQAKFLEVPFRKYANKDYVMKDLKNKIG